MSITGAISNSIDALFAQSTSLGNISQNIANSQSTGYKAVDTQFATVLSQNYNDTSAYGVSATTRHLIRSQGVITGTDSDTDLAISGKGFFVVNTATDGSGHTYYTRNGALTETPASAVSTVSSDSGLTYLTDANGDYLMGWPAGSVPASATSSSSGLTAISFDQKSTMPAQATTAVSLTGTVPASSSGTVSGAFTIYDSSGQAQTATLELTPTTDPSTGEVVAGSWNASFYLPGATTPSATTTVTFDSNGNLSSPTGTVQVGSVAVDLSAMKENVTSDTLSLNESAQNGYPEGKYSSLSIDDTGVVSVNYDNNQSVTVGTLAMAQFVEPDGLNYVSGTLYEATAAAGQVSLGTANTFAGQSSLQTQALEGSTVDIQTEFSNMIVTQRAYDAASQLWGTADKMLQTARDLVRS